MSRVPFSLWDFSISAARGAFQEDIEAARVVAL